MPCPSLVGKQLTAMILASQHNPDSSLLQLFRRITIRIRSLSQDPSSADEVNCVPEHHEDADASEQQQARPHDARLDLFVDLFAPHRLNELHRHRDVGDH